MKRLLAVLFVAPVFLLTGCSTISGMFGGWFGSDKPDPKTFTVEQFYREARDELDVGNFAAAVKSYEALEARYPFGKYAQQAQLDVTYAHYKDGDTAEATAAADRFVKLHPNHAAVDYALYIKGLALFKPDLGFLGEVLNLDASDRDQKALRESFEAFKELVTRFPESIYTADTRIRMVYLVNTLAKHDVAVARYYLKRGAYLAAVNRAQNSIQSYPQAPANEDALVVCIEAYEKMGMNDLAKDAQRVLAKNFPKNEMVSNVVGTGEPWWKFW